MRSVLLCRTLSLAALSWLLAGCGGDTSGQKAAVAGEANGAAIYARRCISCHQADGRGLRGVFPQLAGTDEVTGEPERVIRVLLHGMIGPVDVQGITYEGAMPPWGGMLSDDEIAAVATYIRTAWGNEGAVVSADEVAAVRVAHEGRREPWRDEELP